MRRIIDQHRYSTEANTVGGSNAKCMCFNMQAIPKARKQARADHLATCSIILVQHCMVVRIISFHCLVRLFADLGQDARPKYEVGLVAFVMRSAEPFCAELERSGLLRWCG
jgi:hypothetical protein